MSKAFVIVKYLCKACGYENYIYEQMYNLHGGTIISKEQAMDLIDLNGMKKVHSIDDACIWEMDGCPFYKKYNGYFKRSEKAALIKEKSMQEKEKEKERAKVARKIQKRKEIMERMNNTPH